MSLWLALIWLVCAVICAGVFSFCRKRLADVAQQVSEEFENHVNKILEAQGNAEAQLLEAFANFANSTEAIQAYQKAEAEIFRSPRAKPPWNWCAEDLELWRKHAESKERAGRSRPVILAVVVTILALNTAAAVTSVITLNNVKPVIVAGASSLGPDATLAEQLPPAVSLPPIPTAGPLISTDNSAESVDVASPNVYGNITNSSAAELCDFKTKGTDHE